jgi:cell division protein FtsW
MGSKAKSRQVRSNPDYVLALVVAVLVTIGLMLVYSATFDWSYQEYESIFRIASRQVLWAGLGLVALLVLSSMPYNWWEQLAVPVMGMALLMLILVLLFGQDRFGARRSFFAGSIQPSELAKPAVVIYIAAWLASKGDQIRDVAYGPIPFAMLIGLVGGLIVLQPDIGTAGLIVLTALAMFFFAGADIFQLAAGFAIGGVVFSLLVNRLPYAKQRLTEYFATWRDPALSGHHIQQALIGLGAGGIFGVGPGRGLQKMGYLPTAHTDSIFAVLGEEAGLLGCLLVIGLFALLTYRGFKIAMGSYDSFGALLACGVTCWLAFQALINVGVITGLLPFTGIALPFISFGGSSMVVSMAGIGLLLSVSRGERGGELRFWPFNGKQENGSKQGRYQYANLDRRWGNRGTRLSRSGRRSGSER